MLIDRRFKTGVVVALAMALAILLLPASCRDPGRCSVARSARLAWERGANEPDRVRQRHSRRAPIRTGPAHRRATTVGRT
jgi:hypothetical protein